jgi:hypothetical protein
MSKDAAANMPIGTQFFHLRAGIPEHANPGTATVNLGYEALALLAEPLELLTLTVLGETSAAIRSLPPLATALSAAERSMSLSVTVTSGP